jgi:hypothetical protein
MIMLLLLNYCDLLIAYFSLLPIFKEFSRLLLDHRLTIVSHCQTICTSIPLSGYFQATVRLLSGYCQAINKHQVYLRPSGEIVRLSCFRPSHCKATFRGPVRTLAGHRNHWKVTTRRLLALSDILFCQGSEMAYLVHHSPITL